MAVGNVLGRGFLLIEWKGDIWLGLQADTVGAICVTTNGVVKKDGRLVMGAGIAKQARDRFLGIDAFAGDAVRWNGNKTQVIWLSGATDIIALPTKDHCRDPSPVSLITKSIEELVILSDENGYNKVLLPRPGCGHGGLNWERDVKPLLQERLDDRFIVVNR